MGLFTACSKEECFSGGYSGSLTVETTPYYFQDGTRISFSDDLSSFSWDAQDKIRVFYNGESDLYDENGSLISGVNSSFSSAIYSTYNPQGAIGTFLNPGFYLVPNTYYGVLYPIGTPSGGRFYLNYSHEQTENNSTKHIWKVNPMAAAFKTDEKGKPIGQIKLRNLACVLRFTLNVPAGTYTKAYLSGRPAKTESTILISDLPRKNNTNVDLNKLFSINGGDGTKTPYPYYFGQGITIGQGEPLVLYILVAPYYKSSEYLYLDLYDADGNIYTFRTDNIMFEEGKAYSFAPSLYFGER